MTPRHIVISIACCSLVAVAIAADDPVMTREDVIRAADVASSKYADIKSYYRYEPSYDPASRTWSVNYRLRSPTSPSSGEAYFSVTISDTTGLVSTRFSVAPSIPAPLQPRRFDTLAIVATVCLFAMVAMFIWALVQKLVSVRSHRKA